MKTSMRKSPKLSMGICSTIDRKAVKELGEKYNRPENCTALVVPKITRNLGIHLHWQKQSKMKTRNIIY